MGDDGYTKNSELERRSDFYVLAMHNGTRPDDTDMGQFYVLSTETINEVLGDQKTITERSVQRTFGIDSMSYRQLSRLTLQICTHPRLVSTGP